MLTADKEGLPMLTAEQDRDFVIMKRSTVCSFLAVKSSCLSRLDSLVAFGQSMKLA